MSVASGYYSFYVYYGASGLIVTPSRDGNYELLHGQEYKVGIFNHDERPIDATLRIDGKHVGQFRVKAQQHIVVERPSKTARKFTFYKRDSNEGRMGGLSDVTTQRLGEIEVRIQSGINQGGAVIASNALLQSDDGYDEVDGYEPAGTALGASSAQHFVPVPNLLYDDENETVLKCRLVCQAKPTARVVPL